MDNPKTAYIALGSNLGDRNGHIANVLESLGQTAEIEVTRTSDIIETAPLGEDQPKYLNCVTEIKTTLAAQDLHKRTIEIENKLGRTREEKWAPRTIDLDILLFDDQIINLSDLTIPHRQMHLRSFVLSGLYQLDANLRHPLLKESVSELAARLNGGDFTFNPDLPQLISIAGLIGVGKTTLAKKLADSLDCALLFEPYDKNPFMPEVYAGKKQLALDSQLYFLTSRIQQLNPQLLGAGQIAVSDYVFDKELIYARRLLNETQLQMYEQIYKPLEPKAARPVLVIYLRDSIENCLDRIHKRSRPYEQKIEPQFLEALNGDYEQLFTTWKNCPCIRLSLAKFDCRRDCDIDYLRKQIENYVVADGSRKNNTNC